MAGSAQVGRLADIRRFYALLDDISQRVDGPRTLASLGKYRDWPRRGLYFFFEPSERRTESGAGLRVVRVGTHALRPGSRSTLRQRLSQHRGQLGAGGNHRGSIFRLLVGQALLAQGDLSDTPSWGIKGTAAAAAAALEVERETLLSEELPVERVVSAYIVTLPFLWFAVDDDPGPQSRRGFIERNAISLLSNYGRPVLDAPSSTWLGLASNRALVSASGLWNQQHVNETYDPAFLSVLERMIDD